MPLNPIRCGLPIGPQDAPFRALRGALVEGRDAPFDLRAQDPYPGAPLGLSIPASGDGVASPLGPCVHANQPASQPDCPAHPSCHAPQQPARGPGNDFVAPLVLDHTSQCTRVASPSASQRVITPLATHNCGRYPGRRRLIEQRPPSIQPRSNEARNCLKMSAAICGPGAPAPPGRSSLAQVASG